MWVLVAKLKKSHGAENSVSESARESRKVDGFEIWNESTLTKGFQQDCCVIGQNRVRCECKWVMVMGFMY